MVVVPGCAAPVALHELGDGAALHADAGTDEGNLVGQVQERARAEPLGHLELCRRLEEEDPLAAPRVDHVVDGGVLRVDAADVGAAPLGGLDKVQGLLDLVQHGQRQQVDLGEARVRHRLLVPVHDVAAVRGPGPHGDHLRYGRAAEHHAAHVLAQAARCGHQLRSKLQQRPPARRIDAVPEGGKRQHLLPKVGRVVGVELLRQRPQVLPRQSQGFAEVLDDALDRVGRDGARQDGKLRPEPSVHPLDELVPEAPGEVQVDVRQGVHLLGDEALQGQAPPEGVHVADADEVAHQQRH